MPPFSPEGIDDEELSISVENENPQTGATRQYLRSGKHGGNRFILFRLLGCKTREDKEKILKDFIQRWMPNEKLRKKIYFNVAMAILCLAAYKNRRKLITPRKRRTKEDDYRSAATAPLSLLLAAAEQGTIEKALLGSGIVYFRMKQKSQGGWNRSILPRENAPVLQKELLQTLSFTTADVSALPDSLASQLATPILSALPFLYLAFLYRILRNMVAGDDLFGTKKIYSATSSAAECNKTMFDDVAGLNDTVQEVAEVVEYLKNPFRFRQLGATTPTGVLLYGPPGSGKTLLARAVAGEASVDCFLQCSASDFVEMYVGRGAARVRSLFSTARREARAAASKRRRKSWWINVLSNLLPIALQSESNEEKCDRPCSAIIFIDELDALAKSRSSFGGSTSDEREQTLNQLLTEMDGFDVDGSSSSLANRSGDGSYYENGNVTIIVMAASNRADTLDPAILRRFDRQIHVGYPDAAGREAILQVHARRIPLANEQAARRGKNTSEGENVIRWDSLAADEKTGNFSGADLRNLINEAALLAVRESSLVVKQSHLEHAARRIRQQKESIKSETVQPPFTFMLHPQN